MNCWFETKVGFNSQRAVADEVVRQFDVVSATPGNAKV